MLYGDFDSFMQFLEIGFFDKVGFINLYVVGYLEGNKDIDLDGFIKNVDDVLCWKNKFNEIIDVFMVLVIQFVFDVKLIIVWVNGLKEVGIDLLIYIGIVGFVKLQILIKFVIVCGVGFFFKVLQKCVMDVIKFLLFYELIDVIVEFVVYKVVNLDFNIEKVYFFLLGGIKINVKWVIDNGGVFMKFVNG